MPSYRAGTVILLSLLTLTAGCGGGPSMAPVEGTIKLKGKALDRIQVEFWPEGEGPRSIGETDKDGRYTLTSDNGKRKGAAVGKHKIVLRDLSTLGEQFLGRRAEGVDLSKGKRSRLPPDFGDPHRTPLSKAVSSGPNVIDIELAP